MMPRGNKSAFADLISDGEESLITTPKSDHNNAPTLTSLDSQSLLHRSGSSRWSLRTPVPIYTPTSSGGFQRHGSAAAIRPIHTPVSLRGNGVTVLRPSLQPGTNATVAFERAAALPAGSDRDALSASSVCGGSFSSVNPMSDSRMALYTSVDWPTQASSSLISIFETGFDAPSSTTAIDLPTATPIVRLSSSLKEELGSEDLSPAPATATSSAFDNPSPSSTFGGGGFDAFAEPATPLTQPTGLANTPAAGGGGFTVPPIAITGGGGAPPPPPPSTPLFDNRTPLLANPSPQHRPSLVSHFTLNQNNPAAISFSRMRPYLNHVPQSEPADMPYRKLSEVLPGLFLSGEAAVTEREKLLSKGIKLIITMNGEKHIPPYRVFEFNEARGKFLHRKIASREEFVKEMKVEFRRLYRTGNCPSCGNGSSPIWPSNRPTSAAAAGFGNTNTSILCEVCGVMGAIDLYPAFSPSESTLEYAAREHLGACVDEERLEAFFAAEKATALASSSSSSAAAFSPSSSPRTTTLPTSKIFVRSIAADDSPVYDLSPHFLEISCLTHIVLEEYRRVQLLWGARQVKREDTGKQREALTNDRLPFSGPGVAIHCMAGVSRSTSVLAAYLMKLTRIDVEDILACIKNRRVIINPNPGFRRQLSTWQLQKYYIAHDEGACAMIARQIAQAAGPSQVATSFDETLTAEDEDGEACGTAASERLDQGIGRMAIDGQLQTLEGLLTVYATTNRSVRERRNFGIIIKHLCVVPDSTTGVPALPLGEVTKLVIMFLREQVLNEVHVDCPGLFTNWCEIVGSIIGHCGSKAMASTLLKVIAERLKCRFTAVEMYKANISPIVCIACDTLFGVSFIRNYEALAHEAEEANRPIRKGGKYTSNTRDLLRRMAPMESNITETELTLSGPGSPMSIPTAGLYCGPTALDPLLALHHANVSTGLPRMKELLYAAAGGPDPNYTPQVIRLTYQIHSGCENCGGGTEVAEDASSPSTTKTNTSSLPFYPPGTSPVVGIPTSGRNFSNTSDSIASERQQTRPYCSEEEEDSQSNFNCTRGSTSIVVPTASITSLRDLSYDVRGRTPATAGTLIPLTMALDLYSEDGKETVVAIDQQQQATPGAPMPQNIVVSYPFLEPLANFTIWEREAPACTTPVELAEALGVSVSTIGGPEQQGGGAELTSSSLRSGLTLQLPSRRRGQKGADPLQLNEGPTAEDEAAFQECMARLTLKQKKAITNAVVLQITRICDKMREFLQEATGGGQQIANKPVIPSVPTRATGTVEVSSESSGGVTAAVTPSGLDIEATLFTELLTSASDANNLDLLEEKTMRFLTRKQAEYCESGVATTMWTLHSDALNFVKDTVFDTVVVSRLTGDVQLELVALDANGVEDGNLGLRTNALDGAYETLEGEVLQEIVKRKVASAFMAFSALLGAW